MGEITLITRRNVISMTRPQYVLQLRPHATINTGGGGASLPIAISDVTGLQDEIDGIWEELDGATNALAAKQSQSEKGQHDGYAGLDEFGKVPGDQLPVPRISVSSNPPGGATGGDLWVDLSAPISERLKFWNPDNSAWE